MGRWANVSRYYAEMTPYDPTCLKLLPTAGRLSITRAASAASIADGTGDSAKVGMANIQADNGMIHMIDWVLLPDTRLACY